LKIALTTSSIPPARGIGSYVDDLVRAFIDLGHEAQVHCITAFERDPSALDYPVTIYNVPQRGDRNTATREWEIIDELHRNLLAYGPDALIINDTPEASSLLPHLPESWVKASFVHAFRKNFALDQYRIIGNASVLNHPWLDWVVTGNRFLRQDIIEEYNLPGDQVHRILYGVRKPQDAAVTDKDWNAGEITFLFAGGTGRVKAYPVLLRALRRLRKKRTDWVLNLAGGKEKPDFGELESNIRWLGYMPRKRLFEVMNESHVLLIPSIFETGPILLLEGMQFGLVPIVSNTPSAMREVVERSDFGFVVRVNDSAALADAMDRALDRRDRLPQMSARALIHQREHLTLERQVREWLDLLSRKRPGVRSPRDADPPREAYIFHRRPYRYKNVDPRGILERWKTYLGNVPGPIRR